MWPDTTLTLTLLCARQAIINTLLSKVRIKKKSGFKATDKKVGALPPGQAGAAGYPVQAAFMARLTSLTRRFNQAALPQLYEPQAQTTGGAGGTWRGALLVKAC